MKPLFAAKIFIKDHEIENTRSRMNKNLDSYRFNSLFAKNSSMITAGFLCLSISAFSSEKNVLPYKKPYTSVKAEDKKVNIIFIMADDLGWTGLENYGSDLHETPNINKLANQGMKFTDAYSAAAISSPTRAALMTGKHPARLNMTTWKENSGPPKSNNHTKLLSPATVGNLPLEEFTIAEAFRDAGYFTANVGKWHLGDSKHYPEAQGFDINIGGTGWGMPVTYWYPFSGWREISGEYRYVPGLELLDLENENTYLSDRLTDEALKIIKAKEENPFFLHLSFYTPHTPIQGKPEYTSHFEKKINPEMNHRNPEYAAMISSLDENVGRIIEMVEETGISDRTVIIFYSDNGGLATSRVNLKNNSPLRSGKGSLYEGGIRVPLIIKWPGITKPGSTCSIPVITMDFYPTLLEIAGIEGNEEHNKNIDGVSLVSVLRDETDSLDRESLLWHHPHYHQRITGPVSALRQDKWKLLHYFEDDHLELYNLYEDLSEENNLINEYPKLAFDLYERLKFKRQEVNAKYPSYNPDYIPNTW